MKVASIVGARPQFIKAAMVSAVLRQRHEETLIHTGQHYDENLSQIFFDVLGIPEPDINLGVGSGTHGYQTGRMLEAVETALMDVEPDLVVVYGDTNSTLAGALAAAKLQMKTAHVEAGVRSFNMSMPEEINRVLVDRISNSLLCPTQRAIENLHKEGITEGVHLVGDVMCDAALQHSHAASARHSCKDFGFERGGYLLLTIHRPINADNPHRLARILEAISSTGRTAIFPAHPRTRKVMIESNISSRFHGKLKVVNPADYLTFLSLLIDSEKVITDSGGVQKEAYIFGVPCITLREETEWEETLKDGWNVLVGSDPARIFQAIERTRPNRSRKEVFGDGKAAHKIVEILEREA
ncbi:MAG: non-hydrolyzing UDP-N-acetylglucosamine 2-epimerase [Thermoplasmata archaeon]